ncbi:MAG: flagellar biosynthesis protein FliQ [Chitinivibrionales bacterium]|nr:flagellar biosynthesis protein FliQ [Chitinivibrionales bacterium]MBD3394029.1 flagellar biosynthesis protein FliQ [Chitinivibrionales bacterium]
MADPQLVVDIGRQALLLALTIAGPLLLGGLMVGLAVGIFQAVTQIHEMTLTFIPKILTILGVLLLLMPWMIVKLLDFTVTLFGRIPALIH